MKKRIGLIFSIMLFALVGFTACGNPYKNMKFSLSSERNLDETIELFLNKSDGSDEYDIKDSVVVDAVVSGVGKNLSTDIVVPEFNSNLDIETTKGEKGKTTIKFTAKSEGETKVVVSPAENPDGKFTRTLTFKVSIGVTSIKFKQNAITAIAEGGSLDLSVSPRTYLDILPNETSQTGVKYEIVYPEGSPRDYASIVDNTLYTYKSDNYPVSGNVKFVTLKTTSTSREQLTSSIDIPVIDVDHSIEVDSKYGENDITLTQNNVGKYEVLLAAPAIGLNGTDTISKEMSSRQLHIALGEAGVDTSKYSISVMGDPNTINSNSCISLYPGTHGENYFEYNVNAKYKSAAYDVVFKLEYVGDENDNPENNPKKFEGVFTKYVTVTFKVFVMPSADSLYINGSSANNQTYTIYDAYFASNESNISAENGTPIKVQEKFSSLPNLTYTLSYTTTLPEKISEKGLIINGGLVNESTVLNNNSTFYLKHNYAADVIAVDAESKLKITYAYSLAPSGVSDAIKALYPIYKIEKTINLEMKAGIKDITLENIGLKITEPEEYEVFFEFPEGYDAEDTVYSIVGLNADLVRFEYVDNKILVRPNDNFKTGTARLCVVANNGKQSNYADIVVYLPVLYEDSDSIKVVVDESDEDVFVVGEYKDGKGVSGRADCEIIDAKNNITFTYDTITNLILAENGSIKFDLYNMLINSYGNLERVLQNVNIRLSDDTKNNAYVSWKVEEDENGVLNGTLHTLSAPQDHSAQALTFILTGYKETPDGIEEVEITHTVNIWIFPAISEISISSYINEVFLEDSLGYYDIEKGLNRYQFTYTTRPQIMTAGEPASTYFGEFAEEFSLKNKETVVSYLAIGSTGIVSVVAEDEELERVDAGKVNIAINVGDFITFVKEDPEIGAQGNSTQFKVVASVLDKKFNVVYEDSTEEVLTLFELASKTNNNNRDEVSLLNKIFGDREYIDAEIGGKVIQFGRTMPVSTTIRIKKAIKVTGITTTIPFADGKQSLYFELGDGILDKKNQFVQNTQSFTFNLTPYNAHNKEIDFKIFAKDDSIPGGLGDEYNLNIISSQSYTVASDNTITTKTGVLYLNSENGKLYTKYEDGEYSDEYGYAYRRINNFTFVIEEERRTNSNAGVLTIATIRIVDNVVTLSDVIETAGEYILHLIAQDSYIMKEVGGNEVLSYTKYADFGLYISDGSIENPYQIRDVEGLIKMWRRNILLNTSTDFDEEKPVHYALMNNLSLTNNNFNDYLLNAKNIFRGTFKGNNHSISGLTINHTITDGSEFNIGLFPVVEKGMDGENPVDSAISDLILNNVRINVIIGIQSRLSCNVGGLVGKMTDTSLTNVWVRGNINISDAEDITKENADTCINAGGIAGLASGGSITQEAVSYANLNSNIAIDFRGLPADTATQGVHNLGGVVGEVKDTITISGITVIPNIISRQKDGANVSKANMGGLVGRLSDIDENVNLKDITLSPNLNGFDNIGGAVGFIGVDSEIFINFHHVVVEFQHTETLKNKIVGFDKIGGFVGNHASGIANFDNSYVRNFYTGDTYTDAFDNEKFTGNIVLLSLGSIANASAGGFVGYNNSDVNLYTSYFMGTINTFADTNNVAGIVGINNGNLTLTNAYVDGKIYGTDFPLAIIGGLTATAPELKYTGISTTTTTEENKLEINDNDTPEDTSDDKWVVGSYYRVISTTIDNSTYNEYTFTFSNVSIKQFYSRLNNNYVSFVDRSNNKQVVKEPNASIINSTTLTFAVLTENGAFVVTGTKEVQNFTLGTKTTTGIIDSSKTFIDYSGDNNFVAESLKTTFEALGFIGEIDGSDFYINSYKLPMGAVSNVDMETITYDLYKKLIYVAYNDDSKTEEEIRNQYPNTSYCVQFVNSKMTYDSKVDSIDDSTFIANNAHIGGMYSKTIWADINNIHQYMKLYNHEYLGAETEINGAKAYQFKIRISEDADPNFDIAISEDGTIYAKKSASEWAEIEGLYCFDGDYDNAYAVFDGQLIYSGTTLYQYDGKLYLDNTFETEYTAKSYDSFTIGEDDYTIYQKVSLYTNASYTALLKEVVIENIESGYVVELDGVRYALDNEYKVILPLSIYEITKEYGFASTTTNNGGVTGSYLVDDKGNIIAYKNENDKFIYNKDNAIWAVTDEVNGGLPVLFETLEEGKEYDTLKLLYDTIGHMTGSVVEFDNGNGENSSHITDTKQAYVMIDESNVILFYNSITQNQNYDGINTYVVVLSEDDKEEVEKGSIGNNAPIIVDFSNVALKNNFITLNGKNEYSISSSNTRILSIDTKEINNKFYSALEVHSTGEVTLTFKNLYDDENSFQITVFVVGGITGTQLSSKNTENIDVMSTYVTKTNEYKFGFVNKINDGKNIFDFDPADGGFDVQLTSGEEGIIKINNQLINSGETYTFNMSDNLSVYGVKGDDETNQKQLQLTFTPFVTYGNGQKHYLSYLSKNITVFVYDLAKTLTVGITDKMIIKPEENTHFELRLISSNKNEKVYLAIKDVAKNKYLTASDLQTSLLNFEAVSSTPVSLGNNLFETIYTIYLSMDMKNYFTTYQQKLYQNPLSSIQNFQFEFVPESWLESKSAGEAFEVFELVSELNTTQKIAKFDFTIEGNSVDEIQHTLYARDSQEDTMGVFTINPSLSVTKSLSPGIGVNKSYGLLKLKLQKEYNNAKYIEITTKNTNVSLEQYIADMDNRDILRFRKTENDAVSISNTYGDGIRLWNILYNNNSNISQEVDFVSQFYVVVGLNSKVTQGSKLDLIVRVYDDQNNVVEKTISIDIEYLPNVEILTMEGERDSIRAIGEYLPVKIEYIAIEGSVEWSVSQKDTVYDIDGNEVSVIHQNLMPYLAYWDGEKYVRADSSIKVEDLNRQYAIYVPVVYDIDGKVTNYCPLGYYQFTIEGHRTINNKTISKTNPFDLDVVLSEIENVVVAGTVNNILTIKFSNYTTFTANVIFNNFIEKIMSKTYAQEDTSFEAKVYRELISYEALLSGTKAYKTEGLETVADKTDDKYYYLNAWYIAPQGNINEPTKLVDDKQYVDGSFTFFDEVFSDDKHFFGITASKISTTKLSMMFDCYYDKGILKIRYTEDDPEKFAKVYPFTLQITDNSNVDHPNPIRNLDDFMKMLNFIDESQVNAIIAENPDVDPSELEFGNYILLTNLVLENWVPRELHVSNFDANGYTITIKSWNFNDYDANEAVVAGLFSKIGQYTMVQNLNVNVSHLLTATKSEDSPTSFVKNGEYFKDVTFGVVAGENEGVITNTKVVNLDSTKEDYYLNIHTKQGYADGEICNAIISPFVAVNSGSISNSFVGLNAVVGKDDTHSKITITYTNSVIESELPIWEKATVDSTANDNRYIYTPVYPFAVFGGNKLAGFVSTNSGIISNSYVMGVSIFNATNINTNSLTAGFVNNNLSNGTIYSCFVSGYEYSGYEEDIVNLRATKTTIESRGDIGAFVHTNQGIVENAYAMLNIIINSRYSAGFVYNNNLGTIKNAYTTSITQNIYTQAHGMFVKERENNAYGTLTNCYYLLKEGEMGLNSSNATLEVLSSIDPANAIISYPSVEGTTPSGAAITFANKTSFEGFTFVSHITNYDGIWYMGETNYPRLINTINNNTIKVRSLISSDEIKVEGMEDVTVIYNYSYEGNPNVGSAENPIVISKPVDFARTIVTNSDEYTIKDKSGAESQIYVFGKRNENSSDNITYAPRYVRLVNNISFSLMSLKNTYQVNNVNKYIPLSQVIFNGMLIGNGMTIKDITLNNTDTSGNNLEDFGLFKQIGLSRIQQMNVYNTTNNTWDYDKLDAERVTANTSEEYFTKTSPLIYNVKFGYQELADPTANKVGLLAGSIYDATLLSITIEGQADEADKDVSIVTGGNLVGALAGLIVGSDIVGSDNEDVSLTMADIDIKNVRIKASKNAIVGLADSYETTNGFYNEFISNDGQNLKTGYKEIEIDENGTISNINEISYAGGVAGAIVANNFRKTKDVSSVIKDENGDPVLDEEGNQILGDKPVSFNIEEMSTYDIVEYRDSASKVHSITISENIEVVGDYAGGLFGMVGENTHLRNSKFVLMNGSNNNEAYQRVYGYAFGGLIAGEAHDSVLERVNVEHKESTQLEIDSKISTITAEEVSKSDLFLRSADTTSVSVAIGGIAGKTSNVIILDSYNKANVTNINSKIAGGMIGFASGKNAIGYSHTYANVNARDIIGGLVGLYLYDSFELYLNNATAMNVWGAESETTLKTNFLIYKDATDVRMPEVGNQIAEDMVSNGYKLTNKTSVTMGTEAPGNLFVFLGSVLGKATLAPNMYKFDALCDLEIKDNGEIYVNDTKNGTYAKDLFVHSTRTSGEVFTLERLLNADDIKYGTDEKIESLGSISSIRMFNTEYIEYELDENGTPKKDGDGNLIELSDDEKYYKILHNLAAHIYNGEEYVQDDNGNLVRPEEVVFDQNITLFGGLDFKYNEFQNRFILQTTGGIYMAGSEVPKAIRALNICGDYVDSDGKAKYDIVIDLGTGTGGGYVGATKIPFTLKEIMDGDVSVSLTMKVEIGLLEGGESNNIDVSRDLNKFDLCYGYNFPETGSAFVKMGNDVWFVEPGFIQKTEKEAEPGPEGVVALSAEKEYEYYVTVNTLPCYRELGGSVESTSFTVNNFRKVNSDKYVIDWDENGKFALTQGDEGAYDYFAHRVLTNKVSKSTTGVGKNRYYTYYNDLFYNVYSSTYGVTTRSGSEADGNLNSTFTGLTANNADTDSISSPNVRFDTIFGTQYPISKMTGYFAISQHQYGVDYEEYIHVFNTAIGYGYDVAEETLKTALKECELEPQNVSSLDYTEKDLITVLGEKIGGGDTTIGESTAWFFNEETQLLEYNIGQEGVVTTIKSYDQLASAFNTNNKGKQFYLAPERSDYTINVNATSEQLYFFDSIFRGSLIGEEKEGKYPTIYIQLGGTNEGKIFMMGFEGATIKNINFVFDFNNFTGSMTMTSSSDYFGFIAPFIERSTFDSCSFTFEGMDSISTFISYSISTDQRSCKQTKHAGMLFGGMLASTLKDSEVVIKKSVPSFKVESAFKNFGMIAGQLTSGSAVLDTSIERSLSSGAVSTPGVEDTTINLQITQGSIQKKTGKYSYDKANGVDEVSIGGVVGLLSNSSVTNFDSNVQLDLISGTFGTTITNGSNEVQYSAIGGIVGRMEGNNGSIIEGTNYHGYITIENRTTDLYSGDVTISGIDDYENIAVGGIVGFVNKFDNVMSCFVNFEDNSTDTTTSFVRNDKKAENIISVKLNNKAGHLTSAIGGIVGKGGARIAGHKSQLITDTDIEVTITDGNAKNNIYVGGVVGISDSNSGSDYDNLINLADIKVYESNKSDYIYAGGIFGLLADRLEDSYNQGDILVHGGGEVYAGGIAGVLNTSSGASSGFDSIASYGDIKFVYENKQYYLGGIIGGYKDKEAGKPGSSLQFVNTISLAEIYPVVYDAASSKYIEDAVHSKYVDQIVKNEGGTAVISENMKNTYIDPFIAKHRYYLSENGKENESSSMYIKESYFDVYYAHTYGYMGYNSVDKDKTTAYSSERSFTVNTAFAKDYKNVYKDIRCIFNDGENFAGATTNLYSGAYAMEENPSNVYRLANLYYFKEEYPAGSRFNPNYLEDVNGGEVSGYNVLKINTYKLINDLTIKNNAVLVAEYNNAGTSCTKLSGYVYAKKYNIINYGVVSNMAIVSEYLKITQNFGVLENIVSYDDVSGYESGDLYGLVKDNYGYIYRSGASITWKYLFSEIRDNTTRIGGVVFDNQHIMDTVYCTSMMASIDLDGSTTDYSKITSGGIAYNNAGIINFAVFSGTLLGGKSANKNIVYSGKGTTEYCYSDNQSMYYADNGDKLSDIESIISGDDKLKNKFVTATKDGAKDKTVNYARPYVKDGIKIPTGIRMTIDATTTSGLSYYQTRSEGNSYIEPIFNLTDWARICSIQSVSNNIVLMNDIQLSKKSKGSNESNGYGFDDKFFGSGNINTIKITQGTTFYGMKHTLYGGNDQSDQKAPFFAGGPNIQNLVVRNIIMHANGILGGDALRGNTSSKAIIRDIVFDNCKLIQQGGTGSGFVAGDVSDYIIGIKTAPEGKNVEDYDIVINANCVMSYISGSTNLGYNGYLLGEALRCELYNLKISDIKISTDSSGQKNIGGVVGWIKDSTIENVEVSKCNISPTSYSANNASYVGGVVGYAENCTMNNISVTNTTESKVEGDARVGGIIGEMHKSTLNTASSDAAVLACRIAGGVVGHATESTISNANSLSQSVKANGVRGGIVGYGKDLTITNVENTKDVSFDNSYSLSEDFEDFDCYSGGVAGRLEGLSSISNANINNITVDGKKYVGGIVGFCANDSIGISNSEIKKVNIKWYRYAIRETKDPYGNIYRFDYDGSTSVQTKNNKHTEYTTYDFKSVTDKFIKNNSTSLEGLNRVYLGEVSQASLDVYGYTIEEYFYHFNSKWYYKKMADEDFDDGKYDWYGMTGGEEGLYISYYSRDTQNAIYKGYASLQDDNEDTGHDSSTYYATFPVDGNGNVYKFYYRNGVNYYNCPGYEMVGPSEINTKTADWIYLGLISGAGGNEVNVVVDDSSSITNNSGEEIIIDEFCHWVYAGFEKYNFGYNWRNSGVMLITYDYKLNSKQYIGGFAYDFINDWGYLEAKGNNKSTESFTVGQSKFYESEVNDRIEVNYSLDVTRHKDWYWDNNDKILSGITPLYHIQEKGKMFTKKKGIIYCFLKEVAKESEGYSFSLTSSWYL